MVIPCDSGSGTTFFSGDILVLVRLDTRSKIDGSKAFVKAHGVLSLHVVTEAKWEHCPHDADLYVRGSG